MEPRSAKRADAVYHSRKQTDGFFGSSADHKSIFDLIFFGFQLFGCNIWHTKRQYANSTAGCIAVLPSAKVIQHQMRLCKACTLSTKTVCAPSYYLCQMILDKHTIELRQLAIIMSSMFEKAPKHTVELREKLLTFLLLA
jgi:hypothetical protein